MNLKNNKMLNRYFFISTTKRELSGYDPESVYRQTLLMIKVILLWLIFAFLAYNKYVS